MSNQRHSPWSLATSTAMMPFRCLPLVAGLVVALCSDHPATAAGHARFPRAAAEPIFGPSARSVLEQFETGRQGAQVCVK